MKPFLPILALLSSSAFTFAGVEQADKSLPEPTWFAGGSIGHLSNRDETLYTVHLGANFARSGPLIHSLFAEVGYSELDGRADDAEFIPVTLNYKLDYHVGGRFSLYAGVGVGAAWLEERLIGFATGREDASIEFMAQAFAGVGYEVCSNFQLYAGNRYIWVDESDRHWKSDDTGDDLVMEIGARFRF